jgi:hypothetical protein
MSDEDKTEREETLDARAALRRDFERCRQAIESDVHRGSAALRRGVEGFDTLWAAAIKNAARVYGITETRNALLEMGRPEDVAKMY